MITSVYNGTKTIYRMYKNGNSLSIDTLASVPAPGDRNGVSVQVPIKKTDMNSVPLYRRGDYQHDQHKMYSYLCENMQFFENLVVDAPSISYTDKNYISRRYQDITVKKYTDAGFSLSSLKTEPSILIGNVLYPMPSSISVPEIMERLHIAVQLKIGDVQVTPNREEIIESPETIRLIQQRVTEVSDYLKDLKRKKLTPLKEKDLNMGRVMSQVVSHYVKRALGTPDTRKVRKGDAADFSSMEEINLHDNNVISVDLRDLPIVFNTGETITIRKIVSYVEGNWKPRQHEDRVVFSFSLYTVNAGGALQSEKNSLLSYNRETLYQYIAHPASCYIIAEKEELTALQKAYVRKLLRENSNLRLLSNRVYVNIKKHLRSPLVQKVSPVTGAATSAVPVDTYKPELGWEKTVYRLLTDIDTYLIDAKHIRDVKIPKDFVDQYEADKKARRTTTSGIKRAGKISYRKLINGNGEFRTSKGNTTVDYKDFVAYKGYYVYVRSSESNLLAQMRRLYSCVAWDLRNRKTHIFIEVANATADKFEKSPEVRAIHFSEYLKQAHSYMKQLVTMAVLERVTTLVTQKEDPKNVINMPMWDINDKQAILFPNVAKIAKWYKDNCDKTAGTYSRSAFDVLTGNPFNGVKDFEELAQTYIKYGLMDPIWYVYIENTEEFAAYCKLTEDYPRVVRSEKAKAAWQLVVKNKMFIPTAEANLKFQNKTIKLKTITENEYYNTLCQPEGDSDNA